MFYRGAGLRVKKYKNKKANTSKSKNEEKHEEDDHRKDKKMFHKNMPACRLARRGSKRGSPRKLRVRGSETNGFRWTTVKRN